MMATFPLTPSVKVIDLTSVSTAVPGPATATLSLEIEQSLHHPEPANYRLVNDRENGTVHDTNLQLVCLMDSCSKLYWSYLVPTKSAALPSPKQRIRTQVNTFPVQLVQSEVLVMRVHIWNLQPVQNQA